VTDREGDLGIESTVTAAGGVSASTTLAEGEWTLSLQVTDTSGQTGSDRLTLTVGGPNRSPECGISAPEHGAVVAVGEELRFAGTATDPDVSADRLSVVWTSDVDGELRASTADPDGAHGFATSSLSVATHRISLLVTDDAGATCSESVSVTVGSPPALTLDTPLDGDRVNAGAVVAFTGTVSDAEDRPEDLSVTCESSLDGVFSTAGADASGVLSLSVDDLQAGAHDLEVTVTDADGLYAVARRTLTVNALPTAPTVTLSPDPAVTTDGLAATATGATDPDASGSVIYTYAWTEDGVALAETGATLGASATSKGRAYRVTVTPWDDLGAGAEGFAEITVDNSVPILTSPALSASTGGVGDTLTCSATATDVDAVDIPAVTYAWHDGSTGATYTVAEGDDPGDSVTCTATADDGDGGVTSAAVSATVTNTAPVLTGVAVTPSTAQVGDTLRCNATATDADGGSPTVTYAWPDGSTTSAYVVAASDDPGDTLACTATASDTDGGSVSDTASATVTNTAPVLGTVSISPSTANNDETLSCSAAATDADGGSPTVTYAWTGSVSGGLGSGASLNLSTTTAASAEVVTCAATAADTDGGSDTGSATLTLDNRAPTVSLALTPASATRASTLTCAATAADADGDSPTTTFTWTVNGSGAAATSSSASSSTLAGAFHRDEAVVCAATTTDGKGGSATGTASVTIANTPPSAPVVVITPADPAAGEDLVCEVTTASTDPDGDTIDYTMAWTADGVAFTSLLTDTWTGDTVDGADPVAGEVWACTVTPDDGDDDGATATDSVTVDPPELSGSGTVDLTQSGMDFVTLYAGRFDMGCTAGQSSCNSDESPVMPVTLTHDYYLGETEVTQGQYQALMGSNPSYWSSRGSTHPVENLSWYMAAAFANAVSTAAGLTQCYTCTGSGTSVSCSVAMNPYSCDGYRLPTEAEWEGAARCGEDLLYAGSNDVANVGWYSSNSGSTSHAVATKSPNACGLYDMSGNVWEFTQDWYSSTYYTSSGRTDPIGASSGSATPGRGGGYGFAADRLRVAYRYQFGQSSGYGFLGFRLARTAP
jgi:formylglycine-generating enzyme required for sulfatase activity